MELEPLLVRRNLKGNAEEGEAARAGEGPDTGSEQGYSEGDGHESESSVKDALGARGYERW